MLNSTPPASMPIPFANGGNKNTIPVASQQSTKPGAASLTDGFPPATSMSPSAGGSPVVREDFNGIFYQISQNIQWLQGGGRFVFNASFASQASGYPQGAKLLRSDASGAWLNTVDGNATNPDTGGAGWVPCDGSATILTLNNLAPGTTTLTALQAASAVIFLTGAITANVVLVFPAWLGVVWTVVNQTTGAYAITMQGPSGASVPIGSGSSVIGYGSAGMYCIVVSTPRKQKISASGSFTVPSGVYTLFLSGCAGGGGGGSGGGATANINSAAGGGGGGGGQAVLSQAYPVTPGQVIATVIGGAGNGAAGVASGSSGVPGGNGGDTSFGGLLTLVGGGGGGGGTGGGAGTAGGSAGSGFPAGSSGADGQQGASGGGGASSAFGGGGGGTRGGAGGGVSGVSAAGFGGGGSGGSSSYSANASQGSPGGNGAPGLLIVEW